MRIADALGNAGIMGNALRAIPARVMLPRFFAATVLIVAALPASAKPLRYSLPDETAALKDGPNVQKARENCVGCHSADYVSTQPPKQGRAFWETEVQKMIKLYHAPIADADVKTIADYLATTY